MNPSRRRSILYFHQGANSLCSNIKPLRLLYKQARLRGRIRLLAITVLWAGCAGLRATQLATGWRACVTRRYSQARRSAIHSPVHGCSRERDQTTFPGCVRSISPQGAMGAQTFVVFGSGQPPDPSFAGPATELLRSSKSGTMNEYDYRYGCFKVCAVEDPCLDDTTQR